MKPVIPGIENSYSELFLKIFECLPQGSEVILFGSRAKGTYKEGSDIDLCVKGCNLNIDQHFLYLEKYENLNLPWKLDLISYGLIQEPALKDHIDRVGMTVYSK